MEVDEIKSEKEDEVKDKQVERITEQIKTEYVYLMVLFNVSIRQTIGQYRL